MRQAFLVDQHLNSIGIKMNFGGGNSDEDQMRDLSQIGDQSIRNLRQREMALALLTQQHRAASSQAQSFQPSSVLPPSLFDLYAQQASLQDNSSSLLSSSLLQQAGPAAELENQNQLLYSELLNRMRPSTGPRGQGPGGLTGLAAGSNPFGFGLSSHSSLDFAGGLRGLSSGIHSSAAPDPPAINAASMDPLSAALLRDNTLFRERLLAAQRELQPPSQSNPTDNALLERHLAGQRDLQLSALSNPSAYGSLRGGGAIGSRDWSAMRSLQQRLLAGSQMPSLALNNPLLGGYMGGSMGQHQQGGLSDETSTFPTCLPVVLAVPEDDQKLSSHQVLLRNQIEAFKATEDDLTTHTRGRNKAIKLGQVGIRCKHCARLPVARRQKGSTYFPASLHGLYQAAQNMNTTHMQSGLCTEMPPEYKQMFNEAMANKVSSSVAGRPYWAKTAKHLGLIDTEDGIRFIRDLTPSQIAQIKAFQQQQRQQQPPGRGGCGIPSRLLHP